MINEYENTHIEINIERALFKYNYKITTRTPFVLSVRKKAIFLHIWSAKTIQQKDLSKQTVDNNNISSNITFFRAFLKHLELAGVILFRNNFYIFTILNTQTKRLDGIELRL